jgi:hypothetical protein
MKIMVQKFQRVGLHLRSRFDNEFQCFISYTAQRTMRLNSNLISIIFYTIKAYYYFIKNLILVFIPETSLYLFFPLASASTTETKQGKQQSVFTFSDDPVQ